VVVANTAATTATDVLLLRDSKIMSGMPLRDELSDAEFNTMAGTVSLTVPPHTVYVLRPRLQTIPEYTPYKRVQ
jgi:hypothetical protein